MLPMEEFPLEQCACRHDLLTHEGQPRQKRCHDPLTVLAEVLLQEQRAWLPDFRLLALGAPPLQKPCGYLPGPLTVLAWVVAFEERCEQLRGSLELLARPFLREEFEGPSGWPALAALPLLVEECEQPSDWLPLPPPFAKEQGKQPRHLLLVVVHPSQKWSERLGDPLTLLAELFWLVQC